MQISSRFTIAIHVFACIAMFQDKYKLTSDFLAGSVNVNPVIIRKILMQLKAAGLVHVVRGSGGASVAKSLDDITFYDVYNAVECVNKGGLFNFHENPNHACPVGRVIHDVLDTELVRIQNAMEDEMKKATIRTLVENMQQVLAIQCPEKTK